MKKIVFDQRDYCPLLSTVKVDLISRAKKFSFDLSNGTWISLLQYSGTCKNTALISDTNSVYEGQLAFVDRIKETITLNCGK